MMVLISCNIEQKRKANCIFWPVFSSNSENQMWGNDSSWKDYQNDTHLYGSFCVGVAFIKTAWLKYKIQRKCCFGNHMCLKDSYWQEFKKLLGQIKALWKMSKPSWTSFFQLFRLATAQKLNCSTVTLIVPSNFSLIWVGFTIPD